MEFIVVISSDEKDGLRGRGIIDAQGRIEVSFSNNDRRLRYGTLNEDGNIKWDGRGQTWMWKQRHQRWPRPSQEGDAAVAAAAAGDGEEDQDVTAEEQTTEQVEADRAATESPRVLPTVASRRRC